MPRLPDLLFVTILLAAQIVVFVATTGAGSIAWSHLQATTFEDGAEPPRRFPMVVASNGGYHLMRWAERPPSMKGVPGVGYRLPEREGRFPLEPIGEFVPEVSFQVLDERAGRQRIAVTWSDDDYMTFSRYVTDGTTVTPEYYRIWGGMMALLGLPVGVLAAWLLGRVVRRLRRKTGQGL